MSQHSSPAELVAIEAALAVRRDIQAVASPPSLDPSIATARAALSDLCRSQIGDDIAGVYRRVIRVAAAAEAVAVNLRIASPDLELVI